MVLDIDFKSEIDMKLHKIEIFMSASMMNNPMIKFLHDLMDHNHLIRKFNLEIHYVIGQCTKCRDKNFMTKEKGCLSGGRYCVVDTEYKQNELVMETLRQICIRKQYNSNAVIYYLWDMKNTIAKDMSSGKWQPGNLELYSWQVLTKNKLNVDEIKKCYNDSFKLVGSDGRIYIGDY